MAVKTKSPRSMHIKTNGISRQAIPIHINTCRLVNSGYIPACRSACGSAFAQFKLEFNPHAQEKDAYVIEIFSGAVVQCVNTVTGVQFSTPVFQILNNVNRVG